MMQRVSRYVEENNRFPLNSNRIDLPPAGFSLIVFSCFSHFPLFFVSLCVSQGVAFRRLVSHGNLLTLDIIAFEVAANVTANVVSRKSGILI